MFGHQREKRAHIKISHEEEEEEKKSSRRSDDTPTKSTTDDDQGAIDVCGLSLLNVKKSINFDISRENSSDSFIARETATKDLFFKVENINFEDLYDFNDPESENSSLSLKKKTGSVAKCNNKKIALFRFGSNVHAIDEKCPHLGGPLHLGDIETIGDAKILCVICPWHRWKIDVNTGKVKMPMRRPPLRNQVYPTRISPDGSISIGFAEIDNSLFDGDMDF